MKKTRKVLVLEGMITVEASMVFPIVIIILVLTIQSGFLVRDKVVGNMLSEYERVKAEQIAWHKYDINIHGIDVIEVVNKPLIEINFSHQQAVITLLHNKVQIYKQEYLAGSWYAYNENNTDNETLMYDYNFGLKNATIVRLTNSIMSHVGEITKKND